MHEFKYFDFTYDKVLVLAIIPLNSTGPLAIRHGEHSSGQLAYVRFGLVRLGLVSLGLCKFVNN